MGLGTDGGDLTRACLERNSAHRACTGESLYVGSMDFIGYRLENTWETATSADIIRSNRKIYQSLWSLPQPFTARGAPGSL